MKTIDEFTKKYIQTLIWSSWVEESSHSESEYEPSDDLIERALIDCVKFQNENQELIEREDNENDDSQHGHDFALTRNGHGAGFWDGNYIEEIGKKLTESSEKFGHIDVWFDDETKLAECYKTTEQTTQN